MYSFGTQSKANIAQLVPPLRDVCYDVIAFYDYKVLDASRTEAEQAKAKAAGFSKADFGESAHNWAPAPALDFVPWPIGTAFKNPMSSADKERWITIGRAFLEAGKKRGLILRWGADWNMNGSVSDEHFLDWGHIEIHPWRDAIIKYNCHLLED